jgi:DNA-binding NarL/FixJ family response regulator
MQLSPLQNRLYTLSACDLSDLLGKRVVLADNDPNTLMQMRGICATVGLHVVGTAFTGEEAVAAALRERPDIVLMNILMPALDGLEAAQRILNRYPVCIVLLNSFRDAPFQIQAQEIGVSGFVLKPFVAEEFVREIQQAYQAFRNKPVRLPQADSDEESEDSPRSLRPLAVVSIGLLLLLSFIWLLRR